MAKIPVKVFISYAHKDAQFFEIFKEGVKSHLYTSNSYDFGTWEDSSIIPGSLWDAEIEKNLAASGIAILCVSASFLNSKYIEANEFGLLINKYPGTIIIPVYFNHCNINAWTDLAARQFFKPTGENYDQPGKTDFTFCDLVKFNNATGMLVPNSYIDLYLKDFVKKVELAIDNKLNPGPITEHENTNRPEPEVYNIKKTVTGNNTISSDKVVAITIMVFMILSAMFVFYSLVFNSWNDENKFKSGLGCTMFFGSGVLFTFNRKSKLNKAGI
jgi:hypothetical protein